jgi:large subunit ribosomal protein L17
MRHLKKGRKLKRTRSHRKATLSALATSLFLHKRIVTTVAKAKEARIFAEKLITKAKRGDVHSRRLVARVIRDREAVKELFNEIAPRVMDRPGGYTRVVRIGFRRGDSAELAVLELVDYNIGTGVVKPKKVEREEQQSQESGQG